MPGMDENVDSTTEAANRAAEEARVNDPNNSASMEEFVRKSLKLNAGETAAEGSDKRAINKSDDEFSGKADADAEAKAESDAQELSNTAKEEGSEGAEKEGKDQEEEGETAGKKKEGEAGKEGEKDENEQETDQEADTEAQKGPIPYERFEEVNTKFKATAEELDRIRPLAETQQRIMEFCSENQITTEQFTNLLNIQRLLNTDPQAALKEILPVVEQLQGFTGDKLPADLQAKVDTGRIELADARELAKARAQQQYSQSRFQQFQQTQQQREQQRFQQSLVSACTDWTTQKLKSDPDLRPKKSADAPDGKYELVYDKFNTLISARDAQGKFINPIKTPDDATKLMEQAYKAVNASLSQYTRKPATRRVLTSTGSGLVHTGPKRPEDAKTMREAVQIAVDRHR